MFHGTSCRHRVSSVTFLVHWFDGPVRDLHWGVCVIEAVAFVVCTCDSISCRYRTSLRNGVCWKESSEGGVSSHECVLWFLSHVNQCQVLAPPFHLSYHLSLLHHSSFALTTPLLALPPCLFLFSGTRCPPTPRITPESVWTSASVPRSMLCCGRGVGFPNKECVAACAS